MTLRGFIVSPDGCHSCESRNPVLFSIQISKTFSNAGLKYRL
ncbi:MAG: hypothetical protein ACYCSW_01235 [bacterium]